MLDKNKIKSELTLEQISQLLTDYGGEPIQSGDNLISRTICHNHPQNEASHKLYYYGGSKLFHCYTGCDNPSFDIFELVQKIQLIQNGIKYSLYDAMIFIINYFGLNFERDFQKEVVSLQDWQIFSKREAANTHSYDRSINLKIYDERVLQNFPHPRIVPWEKDHINQNAMLRHNICFNYSSYGILIPHYNQEGQLVGIRERTLIKEQEVFGKYRPAIINGIMYNHPLGFNLYNLNYSKKNIQNIKKAFVFESEKSCLQFDSYFDFDLSVACCGSNLSNYQMELLLNLNVKEVIIGFDKQFKKLNDEECARWKKKLYNIHYKYGKYVQISYLFDLWDLLDYKDSPTDKGKNIFLELYNKRRII